MIRTTTILILTVSLIFSLTGCGGTPGSSSVLPPSNLPSSSASTPSSQESADKPETDGLDEPDTGEVEVPPDLSLDDILENIAAIYGENYLASADMMEDYMKTAYPELTGDMYEDIRGKMAMISAHPDEVIIVKAAEGRVDDVERALTEIRDRKASDALQYPMNLPKTASAQVVRHGDYLAYILLGEPFDGNENATEEERLQHFRNEAQKGVDAFHSSFGG